jgi:hypothetical protein
MIYFLLVLSTLVFLLATVVFGMNAFKRLKTNLVLGLGFMAGAVYSGICFLIQINGFMKCGGFSVLEQCIQYPDVNQIPITRIGFNLISTNLKLLLMNILALGLVFFLIYFLKRQNIKK